MVDAATGVLGIEWIDGSSVRVLLGGGAEGEIEEEELDSSAPDSPEMDDEVDDYLALKEFSVSQGKNRLLWCIYLVGTTAHS